MKKRVNYIDFFRALAIINMVIYHLLYDLKYIFNLDMPFFSMDKWYFYQQYICISFIFLSGVSANYTNNIIKNFTRLFIISIIISLITINISKDFAIYFGVIHFLSIATLISSFIKKYTKNINEKTANILFICCLFIFLFVKNDLFLKSSFYMKINNHLKNLPFSLIFGFYNDSFYSSDYFPIIPWIFLHICGYFFGKSKFHYIFERKFKNINIKLFRKISEKSLVIYCLHQLIIYSILYLIFSNMYHHNP